MAGLYLKAEYIEVRVPGTIRMHGLFYLFFFLIERYAEIGKNHMVSDDAYLSNSLLLRYTMVECVAWR